MNFSLPHEYLANSSGRLQKGSHPNVDLCQFDNCDFKFFLAQLRFFFFQKMSFCLMDKSYAVPKMTLCVKAQSDALPKMTLCVKAQSDAISKMTRKKMTHFRECRFPLRPILDRHRKLFAIENVVKTKNLVQQYSSALSIVF